MMHDSPTVRVLAEIERRKPGRPKSASGSRLARLASSQAEVGARMLQRRVCQIGPLVAARVALARAEHELGTPLDELGRARRDVDALERAFVFRCVKARS